MSEGDGLRDALAASLGSGFHIDEELGGGGMSRVFAARDLRLGRDVLVKVLSPETARAFPMDRFAREIKLPASLQEPHIVPIYAAGATAESLPFYVMAHMR